MTETIRKVVSSCKVCQVTKHSRTKVTNEIDCMQSALAISQQQVKLAWLSVSKNCPPPISSSPLMSYVSDTVVTMRWLIWLAAEGISLDSCRMRL